MAARLLGPLRYQCAPWLHYPALSRGGWRAEDRRAVPKPGETQGLRCHLLRRRQLPYMPRHTSPFHPTNQKRQDSLHPTRMRPVYPSPESGAPSCLTRALCRLREGRGTSLCPCSAMGHPIPFAYLTPLLRGGDPRELKMEDRKKHARAGGSTSSCTGGETEAQDRRGLA